MHFIFNTLAESTQDGTYTFTICEQNLNENCVDNYLDTIF
jgi:hypothetical protein